MRILHLYKKANPDSFGGVETVLSNIVPVEVNGNLHQHEIAATTRGKPFSVKNSNGVKTSFFRENFNIQATPFSITLFLWAKKQFKNFDVLILHYPYPFGDLLGFLFGAKLRKVVFYHSDIVRQKNSILRKLYGPLEYFTLKNAEKIIVTSKNYLESSYSLEKFTDKCVVIPIGIADPYKLQQIKPVVPKFPWDEPYILFVGRLVYYKGLITLLEVAKKLNYNILLVGNGEYEGELVKFIKKHHLTNVFRAKLLNEAEKTYCYAHASLFVLPSCARSEAFGLVLLEASAFNLASVTTEIKTGTSEIVKHGITGMVVEPNNPEDLFEALKTLMASHNLRKKMGEEARSQFLSYYTNDKMSSAISKLLG